MSGHTVRLVQGEAPTRVVAVTSSELGEHTTFLVDDPPHALEQARGFIETVREKRRGDVATLIADALVQQIHVPMPDGRNIYLFALALTEVMDCRHAVIEIGEPNKGHHPLADGTVEQAQGAVESWMATNRPAAPGMH